ncbi:unnamed protein product [Mucor hiemalis]
MSASIPNSLQVGNRIQIGSDRATIKYIGSVKGTKGEWLGIEWDDAQRGKHDGVHQGERYFNCRNKTSGSFIRYHPEKVVTGVSFMTALKERYTVEDDITTIKSDQYDASKDRGQLHFGDNKQIVVETYGFEKILRAQRQLSNLKVVGLAEQYVVSAGDLNDIAAAQLTIEDVDLSRNLISHWETVSDIVQQLPHLVILRLNQLRLCPPPTSGLQLSNLKTLALNQTFITWKDIEVLAPQLTQLEDLQLGSNGIKELGTITNDFNRLKSINLENNLISDWSQVENLSTLPNLETLFLNSNQLTTVKAPQSKDAFHKLTFLRVDTNSINNWNSINALNEFPSLIKLRCKGNPVFKDLLIELQLTQTVGRIGKLTVVDGNSLTNRERVDYERFYLKSCVKDGNTHEAIASIHPRYPELCKIHGEPNLQENSREASVALKDRLFNIVLTQRTISSDDLLSIQYKKDLPELNASVSKRFLPTMTIRNLKNMIQRLLKIPAARQQLILLQPIDLEDRDLITMDINDNLRDLKFYNINDGDEIVVLET